MRQAAEDELPVYRVRLAENAARQVDDEWLRLAEAGGAAFADVWRAGFRAALASLATLPRRCPLAPENSVYQRAHPGVALRQLLHRQRRSGPVWRLLFTIHDEDANEDAGDPPTGRVTVLRLRLNSDFQMRARRHWSHLGLYPEPPKLSS